MSLARDLADLGAVTSRLDTVGGTSGSFGVGRNIIINGGMTIAQRQVQSTNAGSGYITLDRFYHELKYNTDNFTYTTEQVTDAPSGFSKSLKLTCTTAESALAADEYGRIYYVAEGQDLQRIGYGTSACKEVTLSFYVKSSITGNFSASIYLSASGGVISNQAYTINSADTWERKTLTFPTYTTANVPNTNAAGMYINFGLFAGSNYTTAASTFVAHTGAHLLGGQTANLSGTLNATWHITGIQLEVGSTATDFEHEPYSVTLAKAQRYCVDLTPTSGTSPYLPGSAAAGNTTVAVCHLALPVTMRATPSATLSGTAGNYVIYNGGDRTVTSYAINGMSPQGGGINFTASGGGLTANDACGVYANSTNVRSIIEAEL